MRAYVRERDSEVVGENDNYFRRRVRELQMHYTYRGPKLKLKRGRGLGMGKHLEGQTTFGIQHMHT